MNFSLESIRSKVAVEKILENSRRMAEDGRVMLKDIAVVGNRETEVKGTVSVIGDTEEEFDTKLIISDGNIRTYMCSCNLQGKMTGMCVHETATAFAYYRHLYQNTAMRTSTAQFMKDVIDNYIRCRVFEETKQEEGTIFLVPKITLGALQGMSFKLGNNISKNVCKN